MNRFLSPSALLFLVFLLITTLVWVLRGLGILALLPSSIIWLLFFLSLGLGIFSGVQATR